jgi:urease accessory protein
MPAAAMGTRRKPIRIVMLTMITHRTTMAATVLTMTTVITITTIIMTRTAVMPTITAIPMLMAASKARARPRRLAVARARAVKQAAAQPIGGHDAMNESEAAALYRLMTWLSPSFPVGAFSWSTGIEWAVEAGDIVDAASLRDWLAAMLGQGPGFCDGVLLAHAHRAASSRDEAGLREIAELASAFSPSRERQLETSAQGRAFIDIARAAWNREGLDRMVACCDGAIVYPIAVAVVCAAHEIPLAITMQAFLHALTSNWISAGARLIPLGQTDSQRVLAMLEPTVASTAKRALQASLEDLGSATFRADLASMRHETQYTRLFRS